LARFSKISSTVSQDQLQHSEAQFQLLLDTIPGLVWSALPDGNVDYLNQRYREYTGLALREIVGWGWQVAIHPDDLTGHVEYWRMVLASGQPGETEARLRRFDGEYRWFLARAVPLYDKTGKLVKWYGQNTDIHERKCAEERIRLQETELRQALDLAPQHVAVLGPDGVRLSLNQAGLDYFGVTLDVWRTCDLDKLVHPDDRERMTSMLQAPSPQGLVQDEEARLLHKDGKYRWFLIRLNAVRDRQGQIARWYVAATDIEDRKRAEEVLRENEANLRQIVDSIPGLVTHSADGEIEFANQHLLSFFGRSLEWASSYFPALAEDAYAGSGVWARVQVQISDTEICRFARPSS
jgi:PAS domain S-box-containing protein